MKKKILIIAEAGVNHNGNFELALKLVDAACEAGADVVKFQTGIAKNVISKIAIKADYQKQTTGNNESQLEMAAKLLLSFDDFRKLKKYCECKKIMFLSSPFDLQSVDFLDSLGMSIFKIPSGEITNLPYLKKVGGLQKEVIMSTGMADLGEIEDAINILVKSGTSRDKITVLHCNTEYPTPFKDVNLTAMLTIKDALKVNVGYSDHTLGIEVPIAAAALGATVIEKHFTLDKTMQGPDHKASLEPRELKNMIQAIRNIEETLGDGIKRPSESEAKNKMIVRKSIIAARNIKQGEKFTDENITVKRPGSGINPMRWFEVINRTAKKDFSEDDLIEL